MSFSIKCSAIKDTEQSSQHYHELGKKMEVYIWPHVKSSEEKG